MALNTAEFGMTFQYRICQKYSIKPASYAMEQFLANCNPSLYSTIDEEIHLLFTQLGAEPIECTTLNGDISNPHNFILSNGKTLSIKTSISSDKLCPRVVGQAGIDTFNEHFESITGTHISSKEEIKPVILDHISKMIPVFLQYTFNSDYTVFIKCDQSKKLSHFIFDDNSVVSINPDKGHFSFSRTLETWNESNTLYYDGFSFAEIQIHKNRTFKFRFNQKTLALFLKTETLNNETRGMTAEKAVCDVFHLDYPKHFNERCSIRLEKKMIPYIKQAFSNLPKPICHTGSLKGSRGAESKCSYDFILVGNKTLSLKTNNDKICPPEVGQPGDATCYYYFQSFTEENHIDRVIFKQMVFNHIDQILPIYLRHLFDSDFLLWLRPLKNDKYIPIVFTKDFAKQIEFNKHLFSFTKQSIEDWKESNTVKYDGITIGEFQVHNNRNCFKFRVNMDGLCLIVEKQQRIEEKNLYVAEKTFTNKA